MKLWNQSRRRQRKPQLTAEGRDFPPFTYKNRIKARAWERLDSSLEQTKNKKQTRENKKQKLLKKMGKRMRWSRSDLVAPWKNCNASIPADTDESEAFHKNKIK